MVFRRRWSEARVPFLQTWLRVLVPGSGCSRSRRPHAAIYFGRASAHPILTSHGAMEKKARLQHRQPALETHHAPTIGPQEIPRSFTLYRVSLGPTRRGATPIATARTEIGEHKFIYFPFHFPQVHQVKWRRRNRRCSFDMLSTMWVWKLGSPVFQFYR